MAARKQAMIAFKVDEALAEMLAALPNRSQFIRSAVLAALENTCPLCQGTGHLSVAQKDHWDRFTAQHPLLECTDCHELHLVCRRAERFSGSDPPAASTQGGDRYHAPGGDQP